MINGLFLFKYLEIFSYRNFIISIYFILISFLFYGLKNKKVQQIKFERYISILVILILTVILLLYFKVSPEHVHVDRWSALYNWSNYLFQGKYPYFAHTHLNGYGSPFPVWQIIHIPFYFLGDEIWSHFFIIVILYFILRKRNAYLQSFSFFLLLFLSPCYWWEVAVRSDLVNNIFIVLIFILWINDNHKKIEKFPKSIGIISGLLCCTRLFLFIPILLYFLSKRVVWVKNGRVMFFLFLVFGFILPFLPFLVWNYKMLLFFPYNPITLQTRQGGLMTFVLGLIGLFICAQLWKDFSQYLYLVASFLFLFILMMFGISCYRLGFQNCIFQDEFDISYFNICLPFLICSLSLKKNF